MNKNNPDAIALPFLQGGGAMGAMMRDHDWSTSPLGHPSTWPTSLRTVVALMLNTKFPMFVAWGPELGFLYNDAYVDILGAKHPASLGRRFQEIWSDIWSDISPLVGRALQGESTYNDRLALTMRRHGYNEQTWFTYSYSPIPDENGRVVGMHCICVETTEQVLAEAYRNEENERFRTLFEQAPGFMLILRGPEHVFELTNRAYSKLVGHREIIGKPLRDALPEVVEQGFVDLLDQVYATGETYVGRAIPIKLQHEPNGPIEEHFLDFVYQPIRDARGNVTGIFAEGSVVTERKLAEEELRRTADHLAEANQRQSAFLATLAHELRNPMAPIRTGLDLMRLSGDNVVVAAKARQMMERQVDHLVHLVNDLLDIARINTGKINIKKERVQLNDVVRHAMEMTLPAIQAKHHDMSVWMPDEPIWLEADANRLAQVIGNLVGNSAKFTPDNGKIHLSVHLESNEAVIAVNDNGSGISVEALPHIFDMFAQAGQGADHRQGGLGIGLSLVKQITEMHGGTVCASSAGQGQGSTFMLRLPITKPDMPGLTAVLASAASGTDEVSHGLRVLVVDDNQDAAELLKDLLELSGHTAQAVHDGPTALDIAPLFLPDLMLIDIGMPGMNGYELAGALRQLPQLQSTRLVAVTGWGMQEDRAKAHAAGFDRHLTKPVDFENVSHLVSELMSSKG